MSYYDFVVVHLKKTLKRILRFSKKSVSHFDGNKKRAKMNGSTWNCRRNVCLIPFKWEFCSVCFVYNFVCFVRLAKYNWTKEKLKKKYTKTRIMSLILWYYNWYFFLSYERGWFCIHYERIGYEHLKHCMHSLRQTIVFSLLSLFFSYSVCVFSYRWFDDVNFLRCHSRNVNDHVNSFGEWRLSLIEF